ncbi:glycoside hydrolase family 6 protein [Streptomyces sp. HMX112]|uniref:glycoside hydrolase family 6 protein n=1 Tax=Streptomyces sp. HMX112 TaxID=3390850 RepID=UPI003A7F69FD
MSGRRSFRPLAALLLSGALLAGCGGPARDRAAPARAPLAGTGAGPADSSFWVDPGSDAARQAAAYRAAGRTGDARALRLIADRPLAVWPAGDDPAPAVRAAVSGAAAQRRTVVLVAYNIPHRDCGLHSAGGAGSAPEYRAWIDAFATAVGDAPAVVVLEPDAVPHLVDGCTPAEHHDERYQLLAEAVDRLKRQPGTSVYVDAGHPAWIKEAARLVTPLRRAGATRADGFSLNVSNFRTDETVRAFGTELSGLLGGAHFVVDTSRNGAGPPADADGEESWCNPPGRALGTPPTRNTGDPLVDANLWIKRPGESDGPCRGGPPAGVWWPEYALDLARRSAD